MKYYFKTKKNQIIVLNDMNIFYIDYQNEEVYQVKCENDEEVYTIGEFEDFISAIQYIDEIYQELKLLRYI